MLFVVASMNVNASERFVYHTNGFNQYSGSWSTYDTTEFFTLDSFFATMNYQNPPCMTENPATSLRVAIFFLFVASAMMAVTMQVATEREDENDELLLLLLAVVSIKISRASHIFPSNTNTTWLIMYLMFDCSIAL